MGEKKKMKPLPGLYPKLSTACGSNDERQVRIIHPFHPLRGKSFRFVVSKQLWGEQRVTIELDDKSLFSIPVKWTDFHPPDPYLRIGAGRSRFRIEDLLILADLVSVLGGRSVT